VVPEENRPPETEVKNAMRTPMIRKGDTFVAQVQVPAGATIEYGFLITERRGVFDIIRPVWDGDQDYQMVASEDGAVEVKATLALSRDLSDVLDNGRYFLVGLGVLMVAWLSIYFFPGLLDG